MYFNSSILSLYFLSREFYITKTRSDLQDTINQISLLIESLQSVIIDIYFVPNFYIKRVIYKIYIFQL